MSAIINSVLMILQLLLPNIGGKANVAGIVSALATLVPAIIKEYQELLPIVKNIIAALKNDPATTAVLLAQLKQLDAQCDAAFEDAAAAATAEDEAAAASEAAGTVQG